MAVAHYKSILKYEPPDSIGDRFGDFGNKGPAKTVSHQHKVRKRFVQDEVYDGFAALRVRVVLAGPLPVTSNRGSEDLVPFAFEVASYPFPSRSVVPGAVHQNEHRHHSFS
jgi:hypothetical protein